MNIAVIGTGSVGGTLGRRWAELGHSVRFGVRDTTDAAANALVSQINGDARVAGVRDAAADAEVVVLATPYEANAAAISAAGDLTGKVLIDVTNPITATCHSQWGSTRPVPRDWQSSRRARVSTRR